MFHRWKKIGSVKKVLVPQIIVLYLNKFTHSLVLQFVFMATRSWYYLRLKKIIKCLTERFYKQLWSLKVSDEKYSQSPKVLLLSDVTLF